MTDYYKRCENAVAIGGRDGETYDPPAVWCECHRTGLVPLPSSALVIEDGIEAAAERMLQTYIGDMIRMHPADKSDPHMMRLEMRRLLAAAGERP